jgi:hypothetical protein
MSFLGLVALIMLTLLGYSGGTAIAARKRRKPIDLVELVAAFLFLGAACWTGSMLGKWRAIPIWMVLAGAGSILVTKVRAKKPSDGLMKNKVGIGAHSPQGIWEWWKDFSAAVGNFQGRLLFAFFYFVAVTPFAIFVALLSNPLNPKRHSSSSLWIRKDPVSQELKSAGEQF